MLTTLISLGQNKFDSKRLEKVDEVLQEHIIQKHIPGATALVIKDGEIVYNKALGYADIEKGIKLTPNHIFRIASQSKAITSLAAMILWEEGKFLLDEPVSKYVAEFSNPKVLVDYNPIDGCYTSEPASREITIRDLMRHTSGLAYPAIFSDPTMRSIYQKAGVPSGIGTTKSNLKEAMLLLAKQPLNHHPGDAFTYGLNIDLLGYLIEIWSGQKLDVFMRERLFIPLEMVDTYFHVPTEKHDRVVPIYEFSQSENSIEKINHPIYEGVDANFPKLKGTYLSGGAGLNSTLADMVKFYSLYLSDGVYKGKQIVSSKTIELMLKNQLRDNVEISPMPPQPENFQFSIGGFSIINNKNSYLSTLSEGSFGWGGAFNTHGWADPKEKIIAILFTQEYLSPHFSIGEEFQIALYQSIVKK